MKTNENKQIKFLLFSFIIVNTLIILIETFNSLILKQSDTITHKHILNNIGSVSNLSNSTKTIYTDDYPENRRIKMRRFTIPLIKKNERRKLERRTFDNFL